MNPQQGAEAPELLVLGLGNLLCGDDGLGVEAVAKLAAEYAVPEGVAILDGGTLGLALLGHLAEARRVLLVDAIEADEEPGALVRLEGAAVAPAVRERLSVHQVGVADLLDGLHLIDAYPSTLVLLGIVPASLELEVRLSPPVAAALPALVTAVVGEMDRLGFAPQRREAVIPEVNHGRPAMGSPGWSPAHGADGLGL